MLRWPLAVAAVCMGALVGASCSLTSLDDLQGGPSPQDDAGQDGTLPDGQAGADGASDAQDGDAGTSCKLECADLGAECGTVPDGCGASMECGTCPTGQTCGGGGPYQCGEGTCTPKTCT
jgi:hypothetical protein